ncbi:MAG: (Fe-S)-binding protein [Candidatus Njordarchaeales archaeon]
MLPLEPVFELLVNNIRNRGFPFPVKKDICYKWAEELELPKGGETILYTSCLYQLVPYINAMAHWLETAENSKFLRLGLKLLGKLPSLSSFSTIIARPNHNEIKYFTEIPKIIAQTLLKMGINFGSLYEEDIYSGALLFDLGLDNYFREHALKVTGIFRKHGVRKVITLDPHTTYVLRKVYPEFVDEFDIEVVSYLEILSNRLDGEETSKKLTVTIHDPCLYARELGIIEEPREILRKLGVEIIEPKHNKIHTFCCGGPIESIYPSMSKKIATARLTELSQYSKNIITLCPICIANLGRYAPPDIKIHDISQVIAGKI